MTTMLENLPEKKESFSALKAAIIYYHAFHAGEYIQNINDEIEKKHEVCEKQSDEFEFAGAFLAALAVLVSRDFPTVTINAACKQYPETQGELSLSEHHLYHVTKDENIPFIDLSKLYEHLQKYVNHKK